MEAVEVAIFKNQTLFFERERRTREASKLWQLGPVRAKMHILVDKEVRR